MILIKGKYEKIHREHEKLTLLPDEYAILYNNNFTCSLYVGALENVDSGEVEFNNKDYEDEYQLINYHVANIDTNIIKKMSCKELKDLIKKKLNKIK